MTLQEAEQMLEAFFHSRGAATKRFQGELFIATGLLAVKEEWVDNGPGKHKGTSSVLGVVIDDDEENVVCVNLSILARQLADPA